MSPSHMERNGRSWRTGATSQRHSSIVLMLLAQLCSAVLATIGRVLRTGHASDASDAMGTSEVPLSPPHPHRIH
jgi:hypothetical protein